MIGCYTSDRPGVPIVLLPNESIKEKFDKPFELTYVVTLAAHQLSTDLHVKNTSTGAETLNFQALFHTYLRAPSKDVLVTPLQGLNYYDKTEATEELKAQAKVESRPAIDVKKFTDSVYENAGGKYEVVWPGGGVEIKTRNLKDVVVWNPQEEGTKIGDMEAGGWCVLLNTLSAPCVDCAL
jgi:glucose-6-phosphate 1-epimerase